MDISHCHQHHHRHQHSLTLKFEHTTIANEGTKVMTWQSISHPSIQPSSSPTMNNYTTPISTSTITNPTEGFIQNIVVNHNIKADIADAVKQAQHARKVANLAKDISYEERQRQKFGRYVCISIFLLLLLFFYNYLL